MVGNPRGHCGNSAELTVACAKLIGEGPSPSPDALVFDELYESRPRESGRGSFRHFACTRRHFACTRTGASLASPDGVAVKLR